MLLFRAMLMVITFFNTESMILMVKVTSEEMMMTMVPPVDYGDDFR